MSDYTYSNGYGPRCPYCGAEKYADETEYFEEIAFSVECDECGRRYNILPKVETSWQSYPIKEDKSHE